MPSLFSPLELRGQRLRNRIALSPMCQYACRDGLANDWHLAHYGARAAGGAGLVLVEATAVEARGRITPHCLGLWKNAHVVALRRVADFVLARGALPGIQLAHAGVKASRQGPRDPSPDAYLGPEEQGWLPVGPSAKRFKDDGPLPHALEQDEIRAVQAAFATAARRAVHAGFRLIELHFAHGYLGHSFLSPLMNERADGYGGHFDHRVSFLLDTVREVRAAIPEELPLCVRLSCSDWAEGGWTIEDSLEAARRMKHEGVDLVDCSSGGAARGARIPVAPGYQVPFAERIRHEAGVATGAVGLITEAAQANAIVAEGRADLVLLGRQLLREPCFPHQAWVELAPETPSPIAPEYAWALAETRRG